MMLQQVMRTLESLGTEQNRKIYRRHGASSNLFGVSFANLTKLSRAIKTDQPLAAQLWKTGNEDARSLATMIADPQAMTEKELDAWVKDIRYYALADLFARHVASRSPFARKRAEAWIKSREDFVGQAGWVVLALLVMNDAGLPDRYFEGHLATIEAGIHKAKNRTRHAMNGALIAIGIRNAGLRKLALEASARIGKVEVDHGETNCKSPDAAAYIKKAAAYRMRKASAARA